jgi:hypothetical protein
MNHIVNEKLSRRQQLKPSALVDSAIVFAPNLIPEVI